jgi:hypothetical protein
MKYDIYFHNDFDGRASAAVMLAFLRSRGDDIEHYVPVNYGIIPQWIKKGFFAKNKLFRGHHNPAIVVDFPYHPEAVFWFEHHPTTFKKSEWKRKFHPTKFHHYDTSYPSACSLVADALQKSFGWRVPKHITELTKWLDIIDSANYRSSAQTVAMKEPALRANNFIEWKSGSRRITVWSIKFLATRSLKSYVEQPEVKRGIRKIFRNTERALNFYRKNLRIFGGVMVVDLSGMHLSEAVHYAPYYLHPKLLYCIRYTKLPHHFHMNLSANPWRRLHNKVHIGELLRKYGGGGHKGVGGVEITKKKDLDRVTREIIGFLNRRKR